MSTNDKSSDYTDEDLHKAAWLIEHGYVEGDIISVAKQLSSINKQEEDAGTSSSLNTTTRKGSCHV